MTDVEIAFAAFVESPSLKAAQRLEVVLDDAFPNDPLVQECVEILACYRPGGGDLLFDERQSRHIFSGCAYTSVLALLGLRSAHHP